MNAGLTFISMLWVRFCKDEVSLASALAKAAARQEHIRIDIVFMNCPE